MKEKLERIPHITETINEDGRIETLKTQEDLSSKEYIFRKIIENKVLDAFIDDMKQYDFSPEQIELFKHELINKGEDMKSVLTYPYELRKRMLPYFKQMIDNGERDMQFMVDKLLDRSRINNSKMAYHASQSNIRPNQVRVQGELKSNWSINGTEKDHRDDDLPMAYYSFDYEHLYRTKQPKFLYIIESTDLHRTDGKEWGRAPSLSIIDKIDISELDMEVEVKFKELNKKSIELDSDHISK